MDALKAADRDHTQGAIRRALNDHPDAFTRVDVQAKTKGGHAARWQRIPVVR